VTSSPMARSGPQNRLVAEISVAMTAVTPS
jgi:hypothetical protein